MFRNLYDIFDLPDFFDDEAEIRRMYRMLGSRWHPRRNVNMARYAAKKFKELSKAYEILADRESKKEYDRMLKEGQHEDKFNNVLAPFFNDKGLSHYDKFFEDFLKKENSLFDDEFFKKIDKEYDNHLEKNCVDEDNKKKESESKGKEVTKSEDKQPKRYYKSIKSNTVIKNGKKIEKKTTTIEEENGDKTIIVEETNDGKTIKRTELIHHDQDGNLVKEITIDEGTGNPITEHKMLALNNKKEDDIEITEEKPEKTSTMEVEK